MAHVAGCEAAYIMCIIKVTKQTNSKQSHVILVQTFFSLNIVLFIDSNNTNIATSMSLCLDQKNNKPTEINLKTKNFFPSVILL